MDNEQDTTAALAAVQQCLANVSASTVQQTTSSTQQTTSPTKTTRSATHNKACLSRWDVKVTRGSSLWLVEQGD